MIRRALASAAALLMTTPSGAAPTTKPRAMWSLGAVSAADLNTRTGQIEGLGGFDVGRMGRLPDGRWLSFTGDATATHDQLWPVYDNAAVTWDAFGQRRIASPHPGGHFFPRWNDGSEFWPNDFVVLGAQVLVIGDRVRTYPGVMQWDQLGAYGAVVNVPAGGDPAFARYFPAPSSLLDDGDVQWFGAIAYDGAHIYVHGVKNNPAAYNGRDGGYTARVPVERVEVPHRWEFWTGSAWSPRVDEAVPTIPLGQLYTTGLNGTSGGYTLHRRPDGTWAVTTKRGGDLATGVGRYVGSTPWGPWTWEPLLPDEAAGVDCYLVGAAPSIPTVSGGLLVQWSRSGSTPYWAEVPQ